MFNRLLFLITVICHATFTLASGVSYISLGSKNDETNEITSLDTFVDAATTTNPLVVLQFPNVDIMENNAELQSEQNRFFKNFLKNIDTIVPVEEITKINSESNNAANFVLNEVPASASELLYNYPLESNSIITFTFNNKNYDITLLNQFLESTFLFIEETFINFDIALVSDSQLISSDSKLSVNLKNVQNKQTTSDEGQAQLKEFEKEVQEAWENLRKELANQIAEIDSNDKSDNDNNQDDDILSDIWTEGLLSCLLVSALLLFILIVAISWVASLDISYGALEKKADHLKKTN